MRHLGGMREALPEFRPKKAVGAPIIAWTGYVRKALFERKGRNKVVTRSCGSRPYVKLTWGGLFYL